MRDGQHPKFQKRHYIVIADIIHEWASEIGDFSISGIKFMRLVLESEAKFSQGALAEIAIILDNYSSLNWRRSLINMFEHDNPNFDAERFEHACDTGVALGAGIAGGPAVGQFGYEGGRKFDRILGR